MNRVTQFLHKMRFKARQIRTINYFTNYVLSQKDIEDKSESANEAEVLN